MTPPAIDSEPKFREGVRQEDRTGQVAVAAGGFKE